VNLTLGFKPWASMGVLAKKMIDVDMNGVWNTSIGANEEIRLGQDDHQRQRDGLDRWVDRHLSQRRSDQRDEDHQRARSSSSPDVDHEPYEAVNDNANLRTSGFYSDPQRRQRQPVRAFRIP
jgi:hypothetical protein